MTISEHFLANGLFNSTPLSSFPTDTWIYNDKVLIVNYVGDPPVAILIANKLTARSYKVFFDNFWKQAKN